MNSRRLNSSRPSRLYHPRLRCSLRHRLLPCSLPRRWRRCSLVELMLQFIRCRTAKLLKDIAAQYGINHAAVAKLNNLANHSILEAGTGIADSVREFLSSF